MQATRTVNGTELPAPGIWRIDPGHAEVAFVGRHFGLTRIRGRFTGVEGTATIADDIIASSLDVKIDMASVDSGDQTRDDHLRSADLFDVDRHPVGRFRSTGLVVDGASGTIQGELTLKGITRVVSLDVAYLGHARDPWDNDRAIFSASAVVNREDWGISWNMLLETGGLLVSKEIRLDIEVELIRQP
jgi:polyisoprenoid-binding protein YceI